MKLIRSRRWRPDGKPRRQKAGRAETRSTLQSARSREPGCTHSRHGFILTHTSRKHHSWRPSTHERGERPDEAAGSRLLAATRKRSRCVRKRRSSAQRGGETRKVIGSNILRLIDRFTGLYTDQHRTHLAALQPITCK